MRTTIMPWLVTAFFLTIKTGQALAADFVPGSGIVGSPHDFTSSVDTASSPDRYATICVFCHVKPNPNWIPYGTFQVMQRSSNHTLSNQNFFWSSGAETRGGTRLPTNLNTWIGPSAQCLSCHDGSVSIGDVHLGRQTTTSILTATPYAEGAASEPYWQQSSAALRRRGSIDANGRLVAGSLLVGATGDLEGTHPVGIPYPYGRVRGTYNGIYSGDAVDLRYFEPFPRYVKLFTSGIHRIVPGAKIGATGIECATCHDVHNEQVRGPHLLRDTVAELCSDCHRM